MGSFSRDQGGRFSDLDIFVGQIPKAKPGAYERRGVAALHLYWESFLAFEEVLEERHLEVIRPALVILQTSGYLAQRV